MIFTKPMIDLIKEIRKQVPADIKPSIKLANPDIFDEAIVLYHTYNNTILRTLIKELCVRAGSPYSEFLDQPEENKKRQTTKVYRGQTQLMPAPSKTDETEETDTPTRRAKVYRGIVIS